LIPQLLVRLGCRKEEQQANKQRKFSLGLLVRIEQEPSQFRAGKV
jgi:hypothetical protein